MRNNRLFKAVKIVLSFTIALSAISCDPIYFDSYNIVNRSDKDIEIYYKLVYDYDTTITIGANSSLEFFRGGGGIGIAKDYGDEFLSVYFDSIRIDFTDSLKLNKDLSDRANWDFKIRGKGGGTAIYTFNLHDSDMVEK